MGLFNKYAKINKEELEIIERYFQECMPSIDDNNLFMLRKACMYISLVYVFMLIIATVIFDEMHGSIPYLLVAPLLLIYFNVNLYTIRHRGEISTAKTAAICCTFYFLLGVDLGVMDVFAAPAGQALWLPIAVIALPMIFIDRIYKYGFEEFVVLFIMLVMSFFKKDAEHFKRDLYISISAYVISMLSARIILEMRAREALARAEITKLSAMDKLTHVYNKDALLERINTYFARKSAEEYCAMCIIDLDDFKQVNDNLGHNTGDLLLEKVGQILTDNFRAYDIVGRYGGDEFVVVMPRMGDVDILESRLKALQMYINDLNLGGERAFTASIGGIVSRGVSDSKVIFDMADDALYKSKIQGKNCCTVWSYKENDIDCPLLLVMAKKEHDGLDVLHENEGDRFKVVTVHTDNEAMRCMSQYHRNIKIVLIELDHESGLGVFVLKYMKRREGFANIPVLVVAETKKDESRAIELHADKVLTKDSPIPVFRKTIDKLLGI